MPDVFDAGHRTFTPSNRRKLPLQILQIIDAKLPDVLVHFTAAEFSAYVVKLVQKIDLLDEGSEFALTVEEV